MHYNGISKEDLEKIQRQNRWTLYFLAVIIPAVFIIAELYCQYN